jgi:hypothetical protein
LRNVLLTVGLLSALAASSPVTAAAQTVGQFNPYSQTAVNPWCGVSPYNLTDVVCMDIRERGTGTTVPATLYKFGEGVVHAPGSELAWIILTNFDTVTQTVVVELLVTGRANPITRTVTLAPKERKDLALHDLPEFQAGAIATFSTGVYFPLTTGHASLVMRPQTETFSRVTLPPPTVTTSAIASASEGSAH